VTKLSNGVVNRCSGGGWPIDSYAINGASELLRDDRDPGGLSPVARQVIGSAGSCCFVLRSDYATRRATSQGLQSRRRGSRHEIADSIRGGASGGPHLQARFHKLGATRGTLSRVGRKQSSEVRPLSDVSRRNVSLGE